MDHKKSNLFNFSFMNPLISFKQFSPKNQNSIFSSPPPPPIILPHEVAQRETENPNTPFKCILTTQSCSSIFSPIQNSHKGGIPSLSQKPIQSPKPWYYILPTQQFAMEIALETLQIFIIFFNRSLPYASKVSTFWEIYGAMENTKPSTEGLIDD